MKLVRIGRLSVGVKLDLLRTPCSKLPPSSCL